MDTETTLLEARFHVNGQRIARLIALAHVDRGQPKPADPALGSDTVRGDLCRAIIVFIHATFEDILRTAARERLAAAKSQVLNTIPLAGTSKFGRSDKVGLGALDAHRGKTVDQLIQDSVEEYIGRESFTSASQVDAILKRMGLDTTPFKPLYADLDQMMKRRHRIVHEADLTSPSDRASPQWTFADHFLLALWWLAVMNFYALVCLSVDSGDELHRWYSAKWTKAIETLHQARAELIGLRGQPPEVCMAGLEKASERLTQVAQFFARPTEDELLTIAEKMKHADADAGKSA